MKYVRSLRHTLNHSLDRYGKMVFSPSKSVEKTSVFVACVGKNVPFYNEIWKGVFYVQAIKNVNICTKIPHCFLTENRLQLKKISK